MAQAGFTGKAADRGFYTYDATSMAERCGAHRE
jgi:hypothetical protein